MASIARDLIKPCAEEGKVSPLRITKLKGLRRLMLSESFYRRCSNADNYWRYSPIGKFIKRSNFTKICEVGCGKEGITGYFKIRIVGVDIDFWGGPSEFIEPVRALATNLPFGDNTFDLVFSVDMLEHLPPEKRQKAVNGMIRISNRYTIIGCPCGDETSRYERKLNGIYRKLYAKNHKWLIEHIENGLPTRDEIKHYFRGHDFEEFRNVNLRIWYIMLYFDIIMGKLPGGAMCVVLKNWLLSKLLNPFIHFGKTYRTNFIVSKEEYQ